MANVRMPDGVVVAFPDDMPPEQIKALIASKFPDAVPPQPRATDNHLSQGLSGFNEGLGNILGFPVDATTMAMNAGISGINAMGGSLPQINNPVGGSDFLKSTLLAPTIAPESQDTGQQMVRRVGQEFGAMAIPGLGPLVRSSMPLRTAAAEFGATLGSGTGAAIAEQAFPGNPWAEFTGQAVGGFLPGGIARTVRSPPRPVSVDDLRTQKTAAYKATDNLGVAYNPQSYDDLLVNIVTKARADRISPSRHERAYSFIRDMTGDRGRALSLTELDQLRQTVYRDLIKPSYRNPDMEADAHFGQIIVDEIDDLIGRANPANLVSGNADDAARAMTAAREANKRYRRTETIEEAITKAVRRTESTGSGGNINNALRQNIRQILDNPKKRRNFTQDEVAAMEQLVRQGATENFLRLVGKLSPSGNGLMAALGIGGTMMNPALGLAPIFGMAAKGLSDRRTMNLATELQNRVSRGAPSSRPQPTPEQLQSRMALLLAQGANQNKPIEITIRGQGGGER